MPLETKDEVGQFLILQQKKQSELMAICEGLQLDTKGTKDELIDRLMNLGIKPQLSVVAPQAIPLRTRDNNSIPIEAAMTAFKDWRKLIFNAKGNLKDFKLVNNKGKQYKARLRYIRCSTDTLMHILNHKWYLPVAQHDDLLELLMREPEQFETNIIQKPDSNGNSWLMLHCAPRRAA